MNIHIFKIHVNYLFTFYFFEYDITWKRGDDMSIFNLVKELVDVPTAAQLPIICWPSKTAYRRISGVNTWFLAYRSGVWEQKWRIKIRLYRTLSLILNNAEGAHYFLFLISHFLFIISYLLSLISYLFKAHIDVWAFYCQPKPLWTEFINLGKYAKTNAMPCRKPWHL